MYNFKSGKFATHNTNVAFCFVLIHLHERGATLESLARWSFSPSHQQKFASVFTSRLYGVKANRPLWILMPDDHWLADADFGTEKLFVSRDLRATMSPRFALAFLIHIFFFFFLSSKSALPVVRPPSRPPAALVDSYGCISATCAAAAAADIPTRPAKKELDCTCTCCPLYI